MAENGTPFAPIPSQRRRSGAAMTTRELTLSEGNERDIRSFTRSLKSRNRSGRTIQGYTEAILQLAVFHGGADVIDLKQGDIEEYINDVLAHWSGTTAGVRFRSLRAFYNWAVEQGFIDTSPMARMKEPTAEDKPIPIIPDDDLKALLKACSGRSFEDRRDTAIIRVFCEPGSPRVAEMAGLEIRRAVGDREVSDVDLKRDMITLHGKGNRVRVIPFGAKTGTALDYYTRARAKHKLVKLRAFWLGSRGTGLTVSGIAQMLERRSDQAGIEKIHPHQLRHTAAHVWADEGGSEGDAMNLFGWLSPEMPRRYGKSAAIDRAQRASRRMSPADRL